MTTTTRAGASELTQFMLDHGITEVNLDYRRTPMGQYQAAIRTNERRVVLTWNDREELHDEVHRLAYELGLRDVRLSGPSTCQNPECGNRNWMQTTDPFGENALICMGCGHINNEENNDYT